MTKTTYIKTNFIPLQLISNRQKTEDKNKKKNQTGGTHRTRESKILSFGKQANKQKTIHKRQHIDKIEKKKNKSNTKI